MDKKKKSANEIETILNLCLPEESLEFIMAIMFQNAKNSTKEKWVVEEGRKILGLSLNTLWMKKELYGCKIKSNKILDEMKIINLVISKISAYCILRDIEEKIKSSLSLISKLSHIKTDNIEDVRLFYVEKAMQYGLQHPLNARTFEKEIDISYAFLSKIYNDVYLTNRHYIKNFSTKHRNSAKLAGKCIYRMGKSQGRCFYPCEKGKNKTDKPFSYAEIKKTYSILSAVVISKDEEIAKKWFKKYNLEAEFKGQNLENAIFKIKEGLISEEAANNLLQYEAVRQHVMLQQMWYRLFASNFILNKEVLRLNNRKAG